jgi:thymidylate kinase
MIVEFVGCTGAGKTTLAREVRAHAPFRDRPVIGSGIVLDRPLLRNVTNPTAANLIQDVAGLPYFLRAARRDWPFLKLSRHLLREHAPSRFDELMNTRSVMRRIGMFELARQRARGRTVLIDEGTVLIAYHLFVYSTAETSGPQLDRFAALVPLPDRIVYVKAEVPALVERAQARPDRRRQLSGLPAASVAAWIERAAGVFDRVAADPRVRDRVLVVDNTPSDPQARRDLVAKLADLLADVAWSR